MAEKKGEHNVFGWADLLVEGIFGGIRQAVSGAVETAERYVGHVTKKIAERLIFAFCAMVGAVFVLSGTVAWLNDRYDFPGSGSFIVGGALLAVAFILYLSSRK
jgi:hypothetical protein